MLDLLGIPMVREAGCELLDQTKPFFDLSQQDPPTIGTHPTAVKPGHDFTPTDLLKSERLLDTLCFHETASSVSSDARLNNTLLLRLRRFRCMKAAKNPLDC
jgi:hypothetical protein